MVDSISSKSDPFNIPVGTSASKNHYVKMVSEVSDVASYIQKDDDEIEVSYNTGSKAKDNYLEFIGIDQDGESSSMGFTFFFNEDGKLHFANTYEIFDKLYLKNDNENWVYDNYDSKSDLIEGAQTALKNIRNGKSEYVNSKYKLKENYDWTWNGVAVIDHLVSLAKSEENYVNTQEHKAAVNFIIQHIKFLKVKSNSDPQVAKDFNNIIEKYSSIGDPKIDKAIAQKVSGQFGKYSQKDVYSPNNDKFSDFARIHDMQNIINLIDSNTLDSEIKKSDGGSLNFELLQELAPEVKKHSLADYNTGVKSLSEALGDSEDVKKLQKEIKDQRNKLIKSSLMSAQNKIVNFEKDGDNELNRENQRIIAKALSDLLPNNSIYAEKPDKLVTNFLSIDGLFSEDEIEQAIQSTEESIEEQRAANGETKTNETQTNPASTDAGEEKILEDLLKAGNGGQIPGKSDISNPEQLETIVSKLKDGKTVKPEEIKNAIAKTGFDIKAAIEEIKDKSFEEQMYFLKMLSEILYNIGTDAKEPLKNSKELLDAIRTPREISHTQEQGGNYTTRSNEISSDILKRTIRSSDADEDAFHNFMASQKNPLIKKLSEWMLRNDPSFINPKGENGAGFRNLIFSQGKSIRARAESLMYWLKQKSANDQINSEEIFFYKERKVDYKGNIIPYSDDSQAGGSGMKITASVTEDQFLSRLGAYAIKITTSPGKSKISLEDIKHPYLKELVDKGIINAKEILDRLPGEADSVSKSQEEYSLDPNIIANLLAIKSQQLATSVNQGQQQSTTDQEKLLLNTQYRRAPKYSIGELEQILKSLDQTLITYSKLDEAGRIPKQFKDTREGKRFIALKETGFDLSYKYGRSMRQVTPQEFLWNENNPPVNVFNVSRA